MPEKKKRVLVAEDDSHMAHMLMRELIEDFSVSVVDNGMDLFRLALSTKPSFDLIISDALMPYGEGDDVVRMLHGMGIDTPVILVSGLPIANVPAGAIFFQKPFSIAKLLKTAHELLEGSTSP